MIVKIQRIGKEIVKICKEKELEKREVRLFLERIRDYVMLEIFND